MINNEKSVIRAPEIAEVLEVSEGYAYRLIRQLNKELRSRASILYAAESAERISKKNAATRKVFRGGEPMAVRKEKDKNTWYVQTSFDNYMGERKRTTKRGFRTKRDALEWEEEFKRSNSGCKDMTLNSLYERYKEDNAAKIRITTWDNKNNIVETKTLPFLGNRKINEITH